MKLLLYTAENEVDQVLMVVPDNYDKKQADEEADVFVSGAELKQAFDLIDDYNCAKYEIVEYRAYVG